MNQPPFLVKNDTVAIVSTARKISIEEINTAITLLENWGLKVRLGKTLELEDHQFAGTTLQRKTDFQEMLDDPDIKAIWCARGGYGTVKIIDDLDFKQFKKQPKWVIGYSDITVLHNHIHRLNIASLHATMPLDIGKNSISSIESLKNALFGHDLHYTIQSCKQNRTGIGEGTLVGGNLSILYSLLGSTSSIKTNGNILFIEDLDEYLYHIDRMLMNLKRNGYFRNLKGLIVGSFKDMHDNKIPFGKNVQEIVLDILSDTNFPIAFEFPAGHINENHALKMGAEVQLKVQSDVVQLSFRK